LIWRSQAHRQCG